MDSVNSSLPDIVINGLPIPQICFTPEPEKYWALENGKWNPYSVNNIRLRLRSDGLSERVPDGGLMSPVDDALLRIQRERQIDIAIALAGWPAGLLEISGKRILVTEGAKALPARDVPYDNLFNFMLGLFGEKPLNHMLGWLQWARRNIGMREILPGQIPIFVGPAGVGKSLLQKYITRLLGGRDASPYEYMRGSSFNEDMFEAAHLVIEDRFFEGGKGKSREFGAAMKQIAVNHVHRCHGKYKKAVTMWPKWRMTISMNDEAENLNMLPPLDESLRDKIMLFKVNQPKMPVDLGTDEGWKEWDAIVDAELPGFAHYIDNFILADLAAPRFGVKPWHDKTIMQTEAEASVEAIFLQIVAHDLPVAVEEDSWEGSALQLKRLLEQDGMPSARQTRQLLNWNNATGSYLGRLHKRYPSIFKKRIVRGMNLWNIDLSALSAECDAAGFSEAA